VAGTLLLARLLLSPVLHFAAGYTSSRVAESIDRVVTFVGAALAMSVGGLVVSLVITAVVVRRQRI
jgi:hypothetical protein